MYLPLAILASFAFLYSIAAGRIDKTPFTGPIVFISFGVLVGPIGFAWLNLEVTATEMRVLADLTLAMLLFSEAANVDKSALQHGTGVPIRMLLVGLPGVIALGYLCGWLIFSELSLLELAILATTLAATDAALGKAVVTNKAVPARIREALNMESGLNDGLCVPVLLLFITLAKAGTGESGVIAMATKFFAQELGIGIAVGLVATATGSWLYHRALFLAWFGPRGLASIVFAVIVLDNNLPGAEFIAVVVACTIILSAFAHGITANPLATALAARLKKIS